MVLHQSKVFYDPERALPGDTDSDSRSTETESENDKL